MLNVYLLESKWKEKVSFWWIQAFQIWSHRQWLNLVCASLLHLHGQGCSYGKMFLIAYLEILGYSSVKQNG